MTIEELKIGSPCPECGKPLWRFGHTDKDGNCVGQDVLLCGQPYTKGGHVYLLNEDGRAEGPVR